MLCQLGLAAAAYAGTNGIQKGGEFEGAVTLETLDAILDRATSLEEFLKDRALIDLYYEAAAKYYGADKFPRNSFNAILEDFAKLVEEYPEFGARAWEKRAVQPMLSVRSVLVPYPAQPVEGFLSKLLVRLQISASPTESMTDVEIEAGLRNLGKQMLDTYRVAYPRMNRREASSSQAQAFKALKTRPENIQLREAIVLRLLRNPALCEGLNSHEGDRVLNAYSEMRDDPTVFLPTFSSFAREMGFLLDSLPQTTSLQMDRELFKEVGNFDTSDDSNYQFIAIARRFHAIFRGILHRECVGGACDALELLNKARWAIPLLEDGLEVQVLKDGTVTGYLSSTDVTFKTREYLSLEILSDVMKNRIWVYRDGKISKTTLLDWWLEQELAILPKSVSGFVVGQSSLVNNGSGLAGLRSSAAWINGTKLGPASAFKPTDISYHRLLWDHRPEHMDPELHNTALMYDLGANGALDAILLNPQPFDWQQLNDVRFLEARFAMGEFERAKIWASVYQKFVLAPEAQKFLHDQAWEILNDLKSNDHFHYRGKGMLLAMGSQAALAVFRYALPAAENVPDFVEKLKLLQLAPEKLTNLAQTEYVQRNFKKLISDYPAEFTPDKFEILKQQITSLDAKLEAIVLVANRSKSVAEYLAFTSIPANSVVTDRFRKSINNLHASALKLVAGLKPTLPQWLVLLSRISSNDVFFNVLNSAFYSQSTAGEVLTLFQNVITWLDADSAKLSFMEFLVRHEEAFGKLNPSVDQHREYLAIKVLSCGDMLKRMAPPAKSAAQE